MAKAAAKATKQDKDVLILTQAGYDQLVDELDYRKTTLRDEIAAEIQEATALGDLSENTAYSTAMERNELNETRISELEYMIGIAEVTTASASDKVVSIGHTVEIQKVGGEKRQVTLVGKAESQQADPAAGKISIDSPLGAVLYTSKVGDTVVVSLPNGQSQYKVLKIVA